MTAHKAWVGGALGMVSACAGLLVGAMALVEPEDIGAAIGAPPERVHAWWKIALAVLTVLAAGVATNRAVYHVRNRPKTPADG